MQPFHLITRIPKALFTNDSSAAHAGLCYDAETDELFVAAPGSRTLSAQCPTATDSPPRPVYTAQASAQPSSVCLVRHTGTLLVANFAEENRMGKVGFLLVSLSHDPQQWRQQSDLQLSIEMDVSCVSSTLCELANATVLFGARWSAQLLILQLTKTHRLTLLRQLQTPEKYFCVSATVLNGRILIALASTTSPVCTVSVSELVNDQLIHLSHSKPHVDYILFGAILWAGEHLLVSECETTQQGTETAVMELNRHCPCCVSDFASPLSLGSQLLTPDAGISVATWCADGERVCVWDYNSNDILVYSVC